LAAQKESIGPKAVGEESEVPDAHEALGQYMQEEAAQELDSVKGHHA
jgi:hypothetical protein